jgi:hypothetical protein
MRFGPIAELLSEQEIHQLEDAIATIGKWRNHIAGTMAELNLEDNETEAKVSVDNTLDAARTMLKTGA